MSGYKVFNHSSESMLEIRGGEIDLVVTDPPWNMGLKFGDEVNYRPSEQYEKFMGTVAGELKRVLKEDGLCAVICAEKIFYNRKTTDLSDMYKRLFSQEGFVLLAEHPILFDEPNNPDFKPVAVADWKEENLPRQVYSEEGKVLVFSASEKKDFKVNMPKGKAYYIEPMDGHPCPHGFEFMDDILDAFYSKGDCVLDPFMGVANLGVAVLRRGGSFYGYDKEKAYFKTVERKLNEQQRKMGFKRGHDLRAFDSSTPEKDRRRRRG